MSPGSNATIFYLVLSTLYFLYLPFWVSHYMYVGVDLSWSLVCFKLHWYLSHMASMDIKHWKSGA